MRGRKKVMLFALIVSIVMLSAACSGNDGQTQPPLPSQTPNNSETGGPANTPQPSDTSQKEPSEPADEPSTEPVTLLTYTPAGLAEEWFEENVFRFVREHLPHITMTFEGGTPAEEFVVSGKKADLINIATTNIHQLTEVALLEDLLPHIKKHNFDLSIFDDGLIDTVTAFSGGEQLLLLPFGTGNFVTYYNKDIFDRFATPYPEDGMTWNEIYDLAVRLTRVDDGVQYIGFIPDHNYMIQFNQLSLPYVDAETDKAAVNTEGWKRIFETIAQFYFIEGNEYEGASKAALFRDDRTAAMIAGPSQFHLIRPMFEQGNPLNFDVVTFPSFPDVPDTSLQLAANAWGMGVNSEHKDAVMEVLELMFSDEVQAYGASIFRPTALKSEEVRAATGTGDPNLAHVNFGAIYKTKLATTEIVSDYDRIAKSILLSKFNEYAQGGVDVNTILRAAEEEINQAIDAEKGGN